ncbi:MAG TPA: CocE/NonD family hydrolase [Solirubrobacteraceae bacterium]|jgi:fermentation-respiration switch protein FrsA (DUF1100 family)
MRHCLAFVAGLVGLLLTPTTALAEVKPFDKLTCTAQSDGVRFCPGNGSTERVPSWDGVPLDADVTLPPESAGSGPYPTIVMLHGWGSNKTDFEASKPEGDGSVTYHYNNDYYAEQGYAVINYTARGFGNSCGDGGTPKAQTQSGECAKGFIRLADQRYEARDTQYLLGLLVDEKIADPAALGVTGISYGGGQSIELAYLRDRIRCAGAYDTFPNDPCAGKSENSYVPWTSPNGTPLQIAASYPRWPWSDLVTALLPNGRFLDYVTATDGADGSTGSGSPIGVPISSYISGLYLLGAASGFYEPPAPLGEPPWDLTTDFAAVNVGEPQTEQDQKIVDEIAAFHGGFGIPGTPAPLLMESGWNDDLFSPSQSLRVYNDVHANDPGGEVTLQFGDVGHSRGSNKPTVDRYFNDQAAAFFAKHLKGLAEPDLPQTGSVTAFTSTCPASGPSAASDGGPFTASSWTALQRGAVTFSSSAEQLVTYPGGDPTLGLKFDPILLGEEPESMGACTTASAEQPPGTASYSTVSKGFTLMGLPTVTAKISVSGSAAGDAQLDARLWDITPAGQQLLVSRGDYRLSEPSPPNIVFQLHGNGYAFAAGDTVKLELTSNDAPYYRAGNGPFEIAVQSAEVVLPTYEPPNGEQIKSPEEAPLPLPEPAPSRTPRSTGSTAQAGGGSQAAATTTRSTGARPRACKSSSRVRIALPRYRHARVIRVLVFLNGKRVSALHGRSLRAVAIALGKSGAGQVTLRLRVRKGRHVTTRLLRRRYRACA